MKRGEYDSPVRMDDAEKYDIGGRGELHSPSKNDIAIQNDWYYCLWS